jgi:hypothetical protein
MPYRKPVALFLSLALLLPWKPASAGISEHIPPRRVVLHIQDVHENAEAQAHIDEKLRDLLDRHEVGLVGLEGAFGPIDFSWYRAYPHPNTIRAVARYLLREHRISGPAHTALTQGLGSSDNLPPFVGIDDPEHYAANVRAYVRSSPLAPTLTARAARVRRSIDAAKAEIFGRELRSVDAAAAAVRNGSLPWDDYLDLLSRYSSLPRSLRRYSVALKAERAMDAAQVQAERTRLLSSLGPRLRSRESNVLMERAAAVKRGTLAPAAFYAYLKTLCASNGVDLSQLPALNNYIRCVQLIDDVDMEEIFRDASALETKVLLSLAHNNRERVLIVASRRLELERKLLDFSLTKDEWVEYQRHNTPSFIADTRIAAFENFYREAEVRDARMADNFLRALREHPSDRMAVLVTGGFHRAGIDRRLAAAGYTVVSFIPKVSIAAGESGSAYLNVFTRTPTPLDKFFAATAHFLPKPPMIPEPVGEAVTAAADQALQSPGHDGSVDVSNGHLVVHANNGAIQTVDWLSDDVLPARIAATLKAEIQTVRSEWHHFTDTSYSWIGPQDNSSRPVELQSSSVQEPVVVRTRHRLLVSLPLEREFKELLGPTDVDFPLSHVNETRIKVVISEWNTFGQTVDLAHAPLTVLLGTKIVRLVMKYQLQQQQRRLSVLASGNGHHPAIKIAPDLRAAHVNGQQA